MKMYRHNRLVLLSALLLFVQCSRTSQALDLVIFENEKEESGPLWHDLKAVKSSLERAGHTVGRSDKQSLPHATGSVCMSLQRHTVARPGEN